MKKYIGVHYIAAIFAFAAFSSTLLAGPERIINLTLEPVVANGAELTFSFTEPAPGPGCLLVAHDVRYATWPISTRNWSRATALVVPPAVTTPGSTVSGTLTVLTESTTYYSVVRTQDTCGWSRLVSNTAVAITAEPGAIKDIVISWTAPIARIDGTILDDLAGYKVYMGTISGSYLTAIDVGLITQYTEYGLDLNTLYYTVITAYDSRGQESAYSNEVVK